MLIIRLLGAQAVLDGATGRIRTGSSRTLALLGVLIAHTGRPQDRTTIAGEFWPESGDGQALTNLRRELHDLRRILGEDDSLEITTAQLCWHDRGRHDIDLSTFLRESAVAESSTAVPCSQDWMMSGWSHYGASSSSDVRRCVSGCIGQHARLAGPMSRWWRSASC
jgi:DNA-binding SARP family transcriptional activator